MTAMAVITPGEWARLAPVKVLLVRVDDPAGASAGLGQRPETFALGACPERGMNAENSFL
jgi:hypothetical protein